MAKEKTEARRSFSLEYKMEALKILQANDYNYKKTGRELNISDTAIRRWQQNYGSELGRAEMTLEIAKDVTENAAKRQERLLDIYYEIKILILDRMKEIIKNERNLDSLQKTLKTLTEIDGTLKSISGGDDDLSGKNVVNIYEQINNTLIEQGYEPKTPIVVDPA